MRLTSCLPALLLTHLGCSAPGSHTRLEVKLGADAVSLPDASTIARQGGPADAESVSAVVLTLDALRARWRPADDDEDDTGPTSDGGMPDTGSLSDGGADDTGWTDDDDDDDDDNCGDDDDGRWLDLPTPSDAIDLVALASGTSDLVDSTELDPGRITELRLVLADSPAPYVAFDDGSTASLKVPSGGSSGLKAKGCVTVDPDESTDILISFTSESALRWNHGNGWMLHPVIAMGEGS